MRRGIEMMWKIYPIRSLWTTRSNTRRRPIGLPKKGWNAVRKIIPKKDNLQYNKEVLVDMQPLSLFKSISKNNATNSAFHIDGATNADAIQVKIYMPIRRGN